jgi:NAD(P)-dependent dehydrogenase (short-subunit alcohol dehydrogenase family)
MTFRGSVALITGAASGMGQLSAWRLAAEGVKVAALDIDEAGLERTATRAPSVVPIVCDVRDWAAVQQAVAHVEHELGPIDRVTNAAAIAPTAPLLEQPVEVIERLMAINYLGTVHVTKATVPAMLHRGHGDLVNFASLAGWLPSLGFGAYSATKFAVVAFTETLAHEIAGRGVRVACVCPPIVDTPLLDQVGEGAQDLLDATKAIQPEQVLDAIERSIDRGELFVWPTVETRIAQLVRRLAPGVLWKRMEAIRAASSSGRAAPAEPSIPAAPADPESADTGTAPARG